MLCPKLLIEVRKKTGYYYLNFLFKGSRGISFVLSAIVFNVAPTLVELSLVCGILVRFVTVIPTDYHPLVQAYSCGPAYAAVALSTVSLYAAFTLGVTQWRTQFRVKMNKVVMNTGASFTPVFWQENCAIMEAKRKKHQNESNLRLQYLLQKYLTQTVSQG